MKRVAVIGSNCFSGAHFVDLLLETGGYEVTGISRSPEYPDCMLAYKRHQDPPFAFHRLDINSELDQIIALLEAQRPAYVVNFAAQGEVRSSFEHPVHHLRTNTLGTAALCQALCELGFLERYLHISTPEVYGSTSGAIAENDCYDPSSPYAASKAAADLYNRVLYKTYGFPVVTLRSTNVYGPHQQLYRIIPRMAIYLKSGRRLTLDGGGKARKSYIHIRDISEGSLQAMESGEPGETYHLSPDGDGITIREVVETVCETMGAVFEDNVEVGPERPGQDAAYVIDSSKARRAFDWRPRIGFAEGVRQTVDWIERDWAQISGLPLAYEHRP